MEVRKKTDYCQCCKTLCEHNYGEENYNFGKINLKNYLAYKDVYVYECPKCGNISVDISNESDSELFLKLKDSKEFQDVLSYDYLDGVDLEFIEQHSRSVPANLYEAYALIRKNYSDLELYFRTLNKSIELKEEILKKYISSFEEEKDERDEEDIENIKELKELLLENIDENRKFLVKNLWTYPEKTVFIYLILIENLAKLGEQEKFNKLFDWYKSNTVIEDDLESFIENSLKRG